MLFIVFSLLSFPFLPDQNNTKLLGDSFFVDRYLFIALLAFLTVIIYFMGTFFNRFHYKLAILMSGLFAVLGMITILQNIFTK